MNYALPTESERNAGHQEVYLRPIAQSLLESRGVADPQVSKELASIIAFSDPIGSKFDEKVFMLDDLMRGRSVSAEGLKQRAFEQQPFDLADVVNGRLRADGKLFDRLLEWRPSVLKRETSIGASELLVLLAIEGARLCHNADVDAPGLGRIEVKSISNSKSYFHMGDGKHISARHVHAQEHLRANGYEAKSLGKRLIDRILDEKGDDALPILRDLATILSGDLVEIKKGDFDLFKNKSCRWFLGKYFYAPIAAASFHELKRATRFDTMLIINREKRRAVFVESARSFQELISNGTLDVHPSALNFEKTRSTSIGVTML